MLDLCDIHVVPKLTLSEQEIALVLIYSYTLSPNTTLSQKVLWSVSTLAGRKQSLLFYQNTDSNCPIFLPNFFPLVNFAFNMLWYSTPWTATAFSNDPLWLTLFVEGVNDRLLDHYQGSSLPHYCGFKEQEIPRIYTVGMVIYWNLNVNIQIFWDTDFWLSLAVSSNHQN